jgi:hypothetical protein
MQIYKTIGQVLLNYNGKGDAVGEVLTAFLLLGRDYKDLTLRTGYSYIDPENGNDLI